MNKLVIKSTDLPMHVEIVGKDGEHAEYNLMPAGRKFGAFLKGEDARKYEKRDNRHNSR
jgi:hypothetical protein